MHQVSLERDGSSLMLGLPDTDDLLALDQYPAVFVPFGQQPPYLAPIEVPLAGNGAVHLTIR